MNDNSFITVMLPAIFSSLMLIFGLACIMAAHVSRPDVVFAITVNPDFRNSAAGQRILTRFTWTVAFSTILGILLTWLGARSGFAIPLMALGWLSSLAGLLSAYVLARRGVAPFHVRPSTQHEAEVQPRATSIPGGWLGQLGPLLILLGFAIYLCVRWSDIPARFPIHWGIDGKPNGWAAKGPAVFLGSITGGMTCLLMAGMSLLLARQTRRVRAGGPQGAGERKNLRNVQWLLLGINYWMALLLGGLGLLPLFMKGSHFSPGPLLAAAIAGELVLVVLVVVMAIRSGQGGWRLQSAGASPAAAPAPVAVGDRTPDECWKGGVFYWNADDPAMLVEKRFGYGWTLNFGNPRSWLLLGGIILFSVATSVVAIVLARS